MPSLPTSWLGAVWRSTVGDEIKWPHEMTQLERSSISEYERLTVVYRPHEAHQSGLIAVDGTPVAPESVCPFKDCLSAPTNKPSELERSREEPFVKRRRLKRKEAANAAEHSQIISLLSLSPMVFHYRSLLNSFCKTWNVLQRMKRDSFDFEFNHSCR